MCKRLWPILVVATLAGCGGGGGDTVEVVPPPVSNKVLFTEFVGSAILDGEDAEPRSIDDIDFDFAGADEPAAYDALLGE